MGKNELDIGKNNKKPGDRYVYCLRALKDRLVLIK